MTSAPDLTDDLNAAQVDAVRTLSGPLLILAGAGTGKTRVLTVRIAHLIQNGIFPSRILAVTFTNKAAGEMRQRAVALLQASRRKEQQPEISTFHSLCVRILRRQIHRLGYPSTFSICDRHDQESLAREVLRQIKVSDATLRPGDLLQWISRWKTDAVRPQEAAAVAETDQQHLAAAAYRRYQIHLKTKGAVDFDDMLLLTEELFRKFPDARKDEADRFDQLLIDEYQDTSITQYRIAKSLAAKHRNFCVVGDDDQAIYAWRGAQVTHILQFQRDWPDSKVVRLEENYRSTQSILAMANRLIAYNSHRHKKMLRAARRGGQMPRVLQFKDPEEEAQGIVADIQQKLSAPDVQARDFAILLRTNEQSRPFETELRRAQLPYVLVGGMSFFDRKEVRDVLAYLKLLVHPNDDVSLLRILNTPPRGIGQATVTALVEQAARMQQNVWDALTNVKQLQRLPHSAVAAIERFRMMIDQFRRQLDRQPLADMTSELIRTIGYRDELTRIYPDPNQRDARLTAVDEVINALAHHQASRGATTLEAFLDEVTLGQRKEETDKDAKLRRNAIAMMTLHSAKGLEFPQVYLVGMEEGILPHRRSIAENEAAIDEERRLCYVGVTRAQDRLTISFPLTRRKWGKRLETNPSRFLFELTGQAENLNLKSKTRNPKLKTRSR